MVSTTIMIIVPPAHRSSRSDSSITMNSAQVRRLATECLDHIHKHKEEKRQALIDYELSTTIAYCPRGSREPRE
jgi:hypothetical protein